MNRDEIKSRIAQLEDEVHMHREAVQEARNEIQALQEELAGVKPGDIVRYTGTYGRYAGQEHIVRGVTYLDDGLAWIYGSPRKKNGEWSNREKFLGPNWEKVS